MVFDSSLLNLRSSPSLLPGLPVTSGVLLLAVKPGLSSCYEIWNNTDKQCFEMGLLCRGRLAVGDHLGSRISPGNADEEIIRGFPLDL
jgi:hypothetical protein